MPLQNPAGFHQDITCLVPRAGTLGADTLGAPLASVVSTTHARIIRATTKVHLFILQLDTWPLEFSCSWWKLNSRLTRLGVINGLVQAVSFDVIFCNRMFQLLISGYCVLLELYTFHFAKSLTIFCSFLPFLYTTQRLDYFRQYAFKLVNSPYFCL